MELHFEVPGMHVFHSAPIVHVHGSNRTLIQTISSFIVPPPQITLLPCIPVSPAPSHVQVILPSNFSYTCSDSSDCIAYDDVLVMTSYFSPGSRSVPVIMAVVNNAEHLLSEEPQVKTDVISGEALEGPGEGGGEGGGGDAGRGGRGWVGVGQEGVGEWEGVVMHSKGR